MRKEMWKMLKTWPLLNRDDKTGIFNETLPWLVRSKSDTDFWNTVSPQDGYEYLYLSGGDSSIYSPLKSIAREYLQLLVQKYSELYVIFIAPDNASLSEDELYAKNALFTYLKESLYSYGNIILKLRDEIDNITNLKGNVLNTSNTEEDSLGVVETEDESYQNTDNTATNNNLHKFNDTPKAGQNPDLITDTFVTSSDRNTGESTNVGFSDDMRVTSATNEVLRSISTTSETTANEYATRFKELSDTINDLFETWTNETYRRILVREF